MRFSSVLFVFFLVFVPLFSASANQAQWVDSSDESIYNAIGRSFEVQVSQFQGFTQANDYWCWAAVVESIFYARSHAVLDQAELARINFNLDALVQRLPTAKTWDDLISPSLLVDCHIDQSEKCLKGGDLILTLANLGALAPMSDYPMDTVSEIKALRQSLSKNIPAGLAIDSPAHGLVITGIKTKLDGKKLLITLTIFDPWDGSKTTIVDGLPYFKKTWKDDNSPYVAIADYSSVSAPEKACPFLTPADRERLCQQPRTSGRVANE